jgi:radical SAM superfamily enzyme YgiQ (UPF0313 family)
MVLPPLELLYMASTLRDEGCSANIVDANAGSLSETDMLKIAQQFNPHAVIGTVSLPGLYNDTSALRKIKETMGCRVIARTDINYSSVLNEIMNLSGADFCIFGECDITIMDMLQGKAKAGTARIVDGELVKHEEELLFDLDRLPMPARDMIDRNVYYYPPLGKPVTTVQTSRGCPFSCSYYCPYPHVQGRVWRTRSPDNVIGELEDIVSNEKITRVFFSDAVFTLDKSRTQRICEMIVSKNLGISWWCETSANSLDTELLEAMKKSGCRGINICIHSGDSEVQRVRTSPESESWHLVELRNTSKKLGIKMHFLLRLGLPDETKRSIYNAYKLVKTLKPDEIAVVAIAPFPGTPLYAEAKMKKWIESDDWTGYGGSSPIMHTDNLTVEDLAYARESILKAHRVKKGGFRLFKELALEREMKKWGRS